MVVNVYLSKSELERVAARVARRERQIAFQREFERQQSLKDVALEPQVDPSGLPGSGRGGSGESDEVTE